MLDMVGNYGTFLVRHWKLPKDILWIMAHFVLITSIANNSRPHEPSSDWSVVYCSIISKVFSLRLSREYIFLKKMLACISHFSVTPWLLNVDWVWWLFIILFLNYLVKKCRHQSFAKGFWLIMAWARQLLNRFIVRTRVSFSRVLVLAPKWTWK